MRSIFEWVGNKKEAPVKIKSKEKSTPIKDFLDLKKAPDLKNTGRFRLSDEDRKKIIPPKLEQQLRDQPKLVRPPEKVDPYQEQLFNQLKAVQQEIERLGGSTQKLSQELKDLQNITIQEGGRIQNFSQKEAEENLIKDQIKQQEIALESEPIKKQKLAELMEKEKELSRELYNYKRKDGQ